MAETVDSSPFEKVLNDSKCDYLKQLLTKTNSIMSGSLLLDTYTNKYKELETKIKKIVELYDEESLEQYKHIHISNPLEFDIYTHKDTLIEILTELILENGFGISNIKIHYPYQDNYKTTFILTHDAVLQIMLLNHETNISINVIVIKSKVKLISAVKNFDLSFRRIWYDGKNVLSYNLDEINNMIGGLNYNYYKYYCMNNLYLLNKIQKYKCNGFHISLPKCINYADDFKAEEFIIKDIINIFLLSIENQRPNYIKTFFIDHIINNNNLDKTINICYFLSNLNDFTFIEIERLFNDKKIKKEWIELLKIYRNDNISSNYNAITKAIKVQKSHIKYYEKQLHNTDEDKEVLVKMVNKGIKLKNIIDVLNLHINPSRFKTSKNTSQSKTLKKRLGLEKILGSVI